MSKKSKIAIIGSGGHACVVASTLMAVGHEIVGFYDDNEQTWGNRIFDIPVVGSIDRLMSANDFSHGIIAIGKNEIRQRIAKKLDIAFMRATTALLRSSS